MGQDALAAHYEQRAATYAEFGNGALAAVAESVLPPDGRVLDIGCASGGLLARLRPKSGHLAGLEISDTAARAAAQIGDHVVHGAIEDPDLPFEPSSFDLVVLGDVIEHLPDSGAGLRRAVSFAKPGAAVVVSVPNIAHWQARLELLRGRWPSTESGTFDSGHLRFFTIESLSRLMADSGIESVQVGTIVPQLRNHVPLPVPSPVMSRAESLWQLLGRKQPGLMGYQVIATGRRAR